MTSQPPKGEEILDPPTSKGYFTLPNGCPLEDPLKSERVSKKEGNNYYASQLMQDANLIDVISHVTRERIPERYVHAKGVGVFGEFEVTQDISKHTDAKFLNKVAKKTRLFARFSTVAGERGYADTARDLKGAAFKLYTEEGNLDWAFLNPEIFPIRDPAKFPSLVHATKRDPATNLLDPNMFWDYFNHHPEGYNALMRVFSDEGTPISYSKIKIFSVNMYTFTKKNGNYTFVKLKMEPAVKANPSMDFFTLAEATTMAGKDPDYLTRRLYDEIGMALKDSTTNPFPTWKVYAQLVDPAKAATCSVNIFDATKVVPEKEFPWIEFGKITLNERPKNFFTQVEQAAFNPANTVPGWDISPDPLLQIRLFAYGDTQRYRLGVNNDQLPTNRPSSYVYNPTRRDGAHNMTNYANARNYIIGDDYKTAPPNHSKSFLNWSGTPARLSIEPTATDMTQCNDHWRSFDDNFKTNFVTNVAASLSLATKSVRDASITIFKDIYKSKIMSGDMKKDHIDERIEKAIEARIKENQRLGNALGVVAGGEHGEPNYIPPTVPDPATGVVKDIFDRV